MNDDAPEPAADPLETGGDDDGMIMVPLDIASRLGPKEIKGEEETSAPAPSTPALDQPLAASPARQSVANAFADLMGDDMDAEGVSADLVDVGRDLVLWGVQATPENVAVAPMLDDVSDPEYWRDVLDEIDLPAAVETAIAALADEASAAIAGGGEASARRQFVAALGDLLRQAGVDAIAVGTEGDYDWIALNADDFAREADGEPWAPAGGFARGGLDLIPIGVSLGLGGRVSLWPLAAEAIDEPGQADRSKAN